MRFAHSLVAAALAAVASAQGGSQPSGNPIAKPGLGEQVPAGQPYQITWQPTTKGPINIILLRGPSENVVPIATIASGISNSGNYLWTPSESLEPDKTHYGIKIVDVPTGDYQYSTQFGISNPGGKKHPTGGKHTKETSTTSCSTETSSTSKHYPTHTKTHTATATSLPTKTATKTHTKTATATAKPTKTTLAPYTTSAAAVASTGGINPSQASISPKPSTAAGERLSVAMGGALVGVVAAVVAL